MVLHAEGCFTELCSESSSPCPSHQAAQPGQHPALPPTSHIPSGHIISPSFSSRLRRREAPSPCLSETQTVKGGTDDTARDPPAHATAFLPVPPAHHRHTVQVQCLCSKQYRSWWGPTTQHTNFSEKHKHRAGTSLHRAARSTPPWSQKAAAKQLHDGKSQR